MKYTYLIDGGDGAAEGSEMATTVYTSTKETLDWCEVRISSRDDGQFAVGAFDKDCGENVFGRLWIFPTEAAALEKKDDLLK